MIRENFYKLFIAIHAILFSLCLVTVPVLAEDDDEVGVIEALITKTDFTQDAGDVAVFSPVQNIYCYSAGSSLSFTGANNMLYYRTITNAAYLYNSGNILLQTYNTVDKFYKWENKCYGFNDKGVLCTYTGSLTAPTGTYNNVYIATEPLTKKQAGIICQNNEDKMDDAGFANENNLEKRYQILTWSADNRFNPYYDGTKIPESTLAITYNAEKVIIPEGVDGVYFDYMFNTGSTFSTTFINCFRCYYNDVTPGEYSWVELEALTPQGRVKPEYTCIIGMGVYDLSDSSFITIKGNCEAPNLYDANIKGYHYTRLDYEDYTKEEIFADGVRSMYYQGSFDIDVNTTGKDLDEEDGIGSGSGSGSHIGFDNWLGGDGITGLWNYITSVENDILQFNEIISIVFGWMPDGVFSLICVVLGSFVTVLLIKVILYLL